MNNEILYVTIIHWVLWKWNSMKMWQKGDIKVRGWHQCWDMASKLVWNNCSILTKMSQKAMWSCIRIDQTKLWVRLNEYLGVVDIFCNLFTKHFWIPMLLRACSKLWPFSQNRDFALALNSFTLFGWSQINANLAILATR